jgi:hypothetical protein
MLPVYVAMRRPMLDSTASEFRAESRYSGMRLKGLLLDARLRLTPEGRLMGGSGHCMSPRHNRKAQ